MRPPFGFWALNSFAIAYGAASPVKLQQIMAVREFAAWQPARK
jgi:hypothetical protein